MKTVYRLDAAAVVEDVMYKRCETPKTMLRQKEFEKTLICMMEKQDYESISISSLCKEMKVNRKTFYRYFEEKDDVLVAFLDELLDESFLLLEVEPDIKAFFEYWKEKKAFLDTLQRQGLLAFVSKQACMHCGERKGLKTVSKTEILHAGYMSFFMTLLLTWHHTGMHQTTEEMSFLVESVFLNL